MRILITMSQIDIAFTLNFLKTLHMFDDAIARANTINQLVLLEYYQDTKFSIYKYKSKF